MTPQQQADEWLAVYRELRGRGMSDEQIERVVNAAIGECWAFKVEQAAQLIRDAYNVCDTLSHVQIGRNVV